MRPKIAKAGAKQRTGIEEINRAITQMDGVTQQNAALVEQAAAAAQPMQEQTERLSQRVSIFKLGATVSMPDAGRAAARIVDVTPKPVQLPSKTARNFSAKAIAAAVQGDDSRESFQAGALHIALISPPSMRIAEPVIHFAAGDTRKAINSPISSGWP